MSDTDRQDLAGKVVLVTGASRGIGYAAAKEAARRGAHVIAVARTVGGLEELDDDIQALGGATTLVPVDLGDGEGIDRLGKAIFDRWGHLDGFIANAGLLGSISPLAHLGVKEFSRVYDINVTANFRLVRSLDLLFRQAEAGRVVFVSSGAAEHARPFWSLYASTKAALNVMAKCYAEELSTTNVKVNVFYPGQVRTAMRAKAMPGEDPQTLPHPDEIAPALVDLVSPHQTATGKIHNMKAPQPRDI